MNKKYCFQTDLSSICITLQFNKRMLEINVSTHIGFKGLILNMKSVHTTVELYYSCIMCFVAQEKLCQVWHNNTNNTIITVQPEDYKCIIQNLYLKWGHWFWKIWPFTRQGKSKDTVYATEVHYGKCRISCFWSLTKKCFFKKNILMI